MREVALMLGYFGGSRSAKNYQLLRSSRLGLKGNLGTLGQRIEGSAGYVKHSSLTETRFCCGSLLEVLRSMIYSHTNVNVLTSKIRKPAYLIEISCGGGSPV